MMKDNFKAFIKDKEASSYYDIKDFEGADFYVPLMGEGMREKYYSGDKVAVKLLDSIDEVVYGFDYIVCLDDSLKTRIARQILKGKDENHLILHAYNPIREDIEIHKDKIYFIGKIMGLIRTNL